MCEQLQRTGSAILAVQLVEELEERAFDSAKELLPQGAVNVREDVEDEHRRIVCVSDGRCFGASRAGRYDGRYAGNERGDDSCG